MRSDAYQQNIVIDLEFTPVPKGKAGRRGRYEVIEIGAVRVDATGRLQDEFRCLVHPELAEGITPVVQQLTGIRWAQLSGAPCFEEALGLLTAWIGDASTRMVAWSNNDEEQIRRECAAKGLQVPACMNRWLDLQKVFPRAMGVGRAGRQMSLHDAVEWYGTQLTSACEHAALMDARHTAELLRALITDEYLEQRRALDAATTGSDEAQQPEFGVMAGALAALYAQMTAGNVA